MDKKTYTEPQMEVIAIQQQQLLSGSGNGERIINEPKDPSSAMSPGLDDFNLDE